MKEDAWRKMTDVDEEATETHTKKILDLDSPLENHIITTKDDVTYINMDPVPLSMLEVIDGSDTTVSNCVQQKSSNNINCDEERLMLVKVAPDPMSMIEVSDSVEPVAQPTTRLSGQTGEEGTLGLGLWPSPLMNFVNGSQMYTCPLCGESYALHEELKDHLSTHSTEGPFANKFFNTALYDGNAYIQSIKNLPSVEEQSEQHVCSVCSRSFPQLSSLKKHMKMHSGKKPVTCTECGKSYSEVSYLKKHVLTHAGNNQNNFCSICNSKFNDMTSLRQHMQMHAASVKPHSCMICGKLYTRLSVLKRHVMLHFSSSKFTKVIEGNEDIPDEEEGELDNDGNVINDDELDSFKAKRKPQKRQPIKRHVCAICSKAFNSLGNLQRHHRIHTGEKPYVCSICSSSFSQLSHLRQHHQTHTDEKLECPICSVCISNDRNFKRHMKLHTGERPFKCQVCSATFTQQTHLKKHSKTHNNTIYTCSNCNITLPDLSEYKEHMRQHAGERPYACSICDSSFADINVLKEHVETHSRTTSDTGDNVNTNNTKVNKMMKDFCVQVNPEDDTTVADSVVSDNSLSNKNLIMCASLNGNIKDNGLEDHAVRLCVKDGSAECETIVNSCMLESSLSMKPELVL